MTPWTAALRLLCPWGFSRQEYWSGLPFPSPGDLPDPGIEPRSPALQAESFLSEPPGKPMYGHNMPFLCFILVLGKTILKKSLKRIAFRAINSKSQFSFTCCPEFSNNNLVRPERNLGVNLVSSLIFIDLLAKAQRSQASLSKSHAWVRTEPEKPRAFQQ